MPDKARHHLPLLHLFPNMITIAGLCVGLSGMHFAIQARWELAVMCVVAAAVLDSLDGRLARILNVTSDFGAHLDSLADLISFGVAPAFIMYTWQLHELGPIGWAFALFFVMCCAIRLARFNTFLEVDEKDQPEWTEHFFVGMPSPAGGLLILSPLALSFVVSQDSFEFLALIYSYVNPYTVAGLVAFMAVYMASRLPALSIKKIHVPRRIVSMFLALAGLVVILLLAKPWMILLSIGFIYLALLPVTLIYVGVKYKG